jgi:hypothetical protein
MATLSVQEINIFTGLAPTFASAAGGGDEYPNDGRTYCHLKNGSGGSITVTVAVQQSTIEDNQFGAISTANRTFTVAAGAERIIPFLSQGLYNNTNGRVALTYSGVTSLTVAAIRCPVQQP